MRHDQKTSAAFGALLLLVAAGCAGPNQLARRAPVVPFPDIAQGLPSPAIEHLQRLPFVLHVPKGQQIPVDFALDSGLFDLETGDLRLVARRDFWVLFRADGPPLLSDDGVEFEKRPRNAFSLGLRVEKDRPARVDVRLRVRADEATGEAAPE